MSLARRLQNFFGMSLLTDYYYWIGIRRGSAGSPFEFVAGVPGVPQAASSDPYAHWSWWQAVASRSPAYDCVIAQQAFRYERYSGSNSSAQQADPRYYNSNPLNKELTYGWNAYPCNARLHFVCEVEAATFPCRPSPPPPAAPPGLPPPPKAPLGSGDTSGLVESCGS